MKCPFLRQTRVKYCQASAYRKMIVETTSDSAHERCCSPAYADCPAAEARLHGQPLAARCPFLQESTVDYCAAVSIPHYVPASDALMSQCRSGGHLYCEIYLQCADPGGERLPRETAGAPDNAGSDRTSIVDGVPIPLHLSYAPNHMWLDVDEDGRCHVGVDALLARVVGAIEAVSFPSVGSLGQPVAVLTAHGVDFPLVFPNAIRDAEPNVHLRTVPSRITSDPYGAGWLFEGSDPRRDPSGASVREGLMPGTEAVEWMRDESDRLSRFAHELVARGEPGSVSMADGGTLAPGFARYLGRDELIELLTMFFRPTATMRR